ncbi:MAG: AsmA family protein [Candidatus Omnitrophota bacterium]|nr:AsmA family protein [Candidatus Omnitrophota bacterium]
MNKFFRILAIVAIIVVGLVVARNAIAKAAVESGVRVVTGLPLKMDKFRLGLFDSSLGIYGLRLFNPKGYEEKIMVDLPVIFVDYTVGPLFKQQVYLPKIQIHLKELVLVRNSKGELNLNSLKPAAIAKTKEPESPKEKGAAWAIRIDQLDLKIEKVIYKDYSKGETPTVKEFHLNVEESFENLTDFNSVVRLIVVKALFATPLGALPDINLAGLQATVADSLASSKKIVFNAASTAEGTVMQAGEQAKKIIGSTGQHAEQLTAQTKETAKALGEKTKSLTSGLKDNLKLPFGKSEG